ncbi:MAG: hypothetical protein U5L11_01235 [Arhodomonas sp.]|nr:hypothetical protein [Arhodomonas sp.]
MTRTVPLFIEGRFVDSEANEWIDVTNPAANEVIARAPVTTDDERARPIAEAKTAQKAWAGFSFTGSKGSFYGDLHAYGQDAVRFHTETKTVIERWFESDIPDGHGPNMTINLG